METTEFNRTGVALMGWNYNGQDLNTVYFNGNVVFRKKNLYQGKHITITYTNPFIQSEYDVGDLIDFNISIVNDGTETYDAFDITWERTGDTWNIDSMQIGETRSLEEGTYLVTQADILAYADGYNISMENEVIYTNHITEQVLDNSLYTIIDNWTPTVNLASPKQTLTINYYKQNVDGTYPSTPFNTESYTYDYGDSYNRNIPPITGYTPNLDRVVGTITKDITYDIYYSMDDWELIIYYVYQNGTEAATTYQHTYKWFENYSVTSPTITGYTASVQTVSGNSPRGATTVIYNAVAPGPGEIIDL